MYAIHSLLRRFAGTVIYAEPGAEIRIPSSVQQLDPTTGKWCRMKGFPLFEFTVSASSSALASQKLSLKENEIAKAVGAKDRRYTLILGPEVEEVVEGVYVRRTRWAVVSGIFRYESGVASRLSRKKTNGRPARPRTRLPPGAHVERR
jgi:hypothetical protein